MGTLPPYSKKDKIVLFSAIVLFVFGIFNITNSYAQEDQTDNGYEPSSLVDVIILKLISEVGPIVGAILTIGIQFLRKHGVKISQEVEETFVAIASSLVEKQSKWIYEQIKENPKYIDDFKHGHIPPEFGKQAKEELMKDLNQLLEDDKFTKSTKRVLSDNLSSLVERLVTKNKRNLSERSRNLIEKLAPLAVDAALLKYKTKDEAIEKTAEIINDAVGQIVEYFHGEEILVNHNTIEMFVKAWFNRRNKEQSES